MPERSPELDAAVRAVRGESNLDALMPALADNCLARVIVCAPDADHVVRAIAALRCGLTGLLDPPTIANPALHNAMARLIGTSAGWTALRAWSAVAPAGWGAAHAAALCNAVARGTCFAGAAAALIGPGDESAALLHTASDAAVAIRRWGQSDPAAPSAWAEALSLAERDRLIATVRRDSFSVASCIPWLPQDVVNQTLLNDADLFAALDAFAAASPTARALHAGIVQGVVDHAHPMHLGDLTLLACVMPTDEVWNRVQTLIRESPDDAWRVAAAAPWDDLAKDVRAAILECADESDGCAAVAAARGQGDPATMVITYGTTVAFFAALAPRVWDALDAEVQRRWRHALSGGVVHLAVRALGLRPEILAREQRVDDDLVHAMRRHAPDDAALRVALLPITLRAVDPDAAHVLITAMPPPPDPGAFFVIACGRADPDVLAPARDALRTPVDLACAVALQRGAGEDERAPPARAALTNALRGRAWNDLAPILALLTDAARSACMPRPARFARRLARPDRREALRRTLDRLAALPPEVAIPAHVALHRRTKRRTDAFDAAEALAHALQTHGGVGLEIADALADDHLCQALLPLPEDAALANALRALAHDDLPTARRLARACHDGDWRAAIRITLALPAHHRAGVTPAAETLVTRLARPDRREALRRALARLASLPPEVDIPARFALDRWGTGSADAPEAADALAEALRGHGDVFLELADAITRSAGRRALLPLPDDPALAGALRALAQDDPPTARRLAQALRGRSWRDALQALLHAPPHPARAVWQAFNDDARRAIGAVVAAASPDADPLALHDPIAALALAALHADDADLRTAGVAALTARRARIRAIWGGLPPKVQQLLGEMPAFADLSEQRETRAIRRGPRR